MATEQTLERDLDVLRNRTLPAWGIKAVSFQFILLLSAAFILPAVTHAIGLPVRWLLPMHWPVILAGLCYGWRSGAVIGIGAPIVSYLFSGMPPAFMLPSMAFELGVYGCLAGLSKEGFKLGNFASVIISLIGGRIAFLSVVLLTGAISLPFLQYLQTAMLPGLPAAVAQVALLPIIAKWWVGQSSDMA